MLLWEHPLKHTILPIVFRTACELFLQTWVTSATTRQIKRSLVCAAYFLEQPKGYMQWDRSFRTKSTEPSLTRSNTSHLKLPRNSWRCSTLRFPKITEFQCVTILTFIGTWGHQQIYLWCHSWTNLPHKHNQLPCWDALVCKLKRGYTILVGQIQNVADKSGRKRDAVPPQLHKFQHYFYPDVW